MKKQISHTSSASLFLQRGCFIYFLSCFSPCVYTAAAQSISIDTCMYPVLHGAVQRFSSGIEYVTPDYDPHALPQPSSYLSLMVLAPILYKKYLRNFSDQFIHLQTKYPHK